MTSPNQYDEVMARLNATKPVVDRDPFIGEGLHESLIVTSIETFNDQKWGKSVRANFKVEKSTCHPAGQGVVKIWNLFKPSKFPTQATDADQFAQFVTILQGIPEGTHGASCVALLKSRAEGGNSEAQPARGARIRGFGVAVGNPNPTTGKRYVRVQWTNIPQDGNMITQARTQLDAEQPYTPREQAAPQGYAQPPAQQYAQPPQGYGQQPMQPQYPTQPVAPAQGYAQPPVAPQGYGASAPAQPQGAPAGGFLSMIPPRQ